jgi:hypothetical protein
MEVMEGKNMKRSWARPEMVILSRKRSDEFILASCKEGSGSEAAINNGCEFDPGCGACAT